MYNETKKMLKTVEIISVVAGAAAVIGGTIAMYQCVKKAVDNMQVHIYIPEKEQNESDASAEEVSSEECSESENQERKILEMNVELQMDNRRKTKHAMEPKKLQALRIALKSLKQD